MSEIITTAKLAFEKMIKDFGSDPYCLTGHVPEMELWAKYICKQHPEADEEVVLLSVWLHDIGHYPIPTEIDHAIRSEQRAKELLEGAQYPSDKLNAVLHCVRAHRCKDVTPETLEAKIIAFCDSASHMTDTMYMDIARDCKVNKCNYDVYPKMDRDMRDLAWFPEEQAKLVGLHTAWKQLLIEYDKIDI